MGDFDARPRRARTVLAPLAVVVGVAVAAAALAPGAPSSSPEEQ